MGLGFEAVWLSHTVSLLTVFNYLVGYRLKRITVQGTVLIVLSRAMQLV